MVIYLGMRDGIILETLLGDPFGIDYGIVLGTNDVSFDGETQ